MTDIIIIILAVSVTYTFVYFYREWALKKSIIDLPNERSSHLSPTPRGGGIGIVITFYLVIIYLFLQQEISRKLFFALLPGIGIALLGFIDDKISLSPKLRFTGQVFLSAVALYFLGGFSGYFLKDLGVVWFLIGLLGFVWFINLFNFLDGSDGYASMEAISVSLIMWFFTGSDILLYLCFSVIGFLIWNWPKAKIFMGDVGSTTLGFILIVLGVYMHNIHCLDFLFWLLMTSLFWFDATATLIRRFLNRENLSEAHKKHIYQRAIQGGLSHLQVLLAGLAVNGILFVVAIMIEKSIISFLLGYFLTICILIIILKRVDRIFPFLNN
jgi:Fuc2NAc and GlcNAc transferase